MGTGELARAPKASCFKQLFPIIRSLYGEFRRYAPVGGGGWGLLAFVISGIVEIVRIVISRPACARHCEWPRKALG